MNPKYLKIILLFFVSVLTAGEYHTHIVEMEMLQGKIESHEKKIVELLEEKKHTTDQAYIHEILDEVVKNHNEVIKSIKKLTVIKSHVKYEHPEKGKEVEEKYKKYDLKQLSDFEKDIGLEKILDQALKQVHEKYPDTQKKIKESNVEKEKVEDRPKLSY
jgi:hypothetical protein